MFITEDTKKTRAIEKELFTTVYQWGRVGVVTDELCNTFQSYMKDLEYELYQQFCDMHEICSACGEDSTTGYHNNAECN